MEQENHDSVGILNVPQDKSTRCDHPSAGLVQTTQQCAHQFANCVIDDMST